MNRDRASLRTAVLIAVVAMAADVFFVCWSPNFDIFILLFFIAPVTFLIFVVLAILGGKKALLRLASVLLLSLAATFLIGHYSAPLRGEIRWWSGRTTWKQRVLADQEDSGQLKHIEWDGWGMFAQDTQVYLVYDPRDRLKNFVETAKGKHAPGLPCDVWRVQRLEAYWYSVTFYTETAWDACTY